MIIGIIPARFASTRLMGKPLAKIGEKPMIQHTYESALKSKLLNDIIIAVDDQKVFDTVAGFGARVVMTPSNIQTGSDRIAYVAKNFDDDDIIVNIQGDEPFIPGRMIDEAIEPLLFDHSVDVSTLAKQIDRVEEFKSPDTVKVVFDYNNCALYFSRSPIPYIRDAKSNSERVKSGEIYKHVGLYVYRNHALKTFTSLPLTDLEKLEKLEQLRMLENEMKIKVVVTELDSLSVDTNEGLEAARKFFAESNNTDKEEK